MNLKRAVLTRAADGHRIVDVLAHFHQGRRDDFRYVIRKRLDDGAEAQDTAVAPIHRFRRNRVHRRSLAGDRGGRGRRFGRFRRLHSRLGQFPEELEQIGGNGGEATVEEAAQSGAGRLANLQLFVD